MHFTSTTVRLARAGGVMTALLLGSISYAPAVGAQPTPPGGGGGGVTTPEPCGGELLPCPPDPCDTDMPPEDCPPPPCEDGATPVDGECPPPPDPCEGDQPPEDCPVPCEDGATPVDGECPPPPDPCEGDQPPEDCGTDNTPDPGGHGTIDQPVPGTPTFTG